MVLKTKNRLKSFFLFLLAGSSIMLSCETEEEITENIIYQGPEMVTDDLVLTYSDSGRVSVKLTTAQQLRKQNKDEVYPKAVYVTFYNDDAVEYSSLRGDSGKYFQKENKYLIEGNVFFFNRDEQQSLSTDELTWDPRGKKIYTDKRVVVNTPTDRLEGVGMNAAQDFSTYEFKKVTGVFLVDSLVTEPQPIIVVSDSTNN